MKPALLPIVPTRKMSEAIAFVCKTCGSVVEENLYWPLSKSVGLHARNGQCGGRKQIVLLAFQTALLVSPSEGAGATPGMGDSSQNRCSAGAAVVSGRATRS